MLLVRDIRLPLSVPESQAYAQALRLARVPAYKVAGCGVAKLSVDARHGQPHLVYTIAITLNDEGEAPAFAGASPCVALKEKTVLQVKNGTEPLENRPVVCGLGPAGLFCALLLARQGFRPLVLERGPERSRRVAAVGQWAPGAPPEIAWKQKPHVGTDLLRGVIRSIRQEIEALGGEVWFDTKLTGLMTDQGRLCGVATTKGELPCRALVLAVGHSARDTFDMLLASGLELTCKPFSVGFRAEHLQAPGDRAL